MISEIPLRCTVRSCGLPLLRGAGGAGCERNHWFDVARSGYLNLLQPQDRRAPEPGDHRAAVDARRRLFDSGVLEPLYAPLRELVPPDARVFDAGCGEGSFLGRVPALGRHRAGADLSTHAVDLAAKRFDGVTWIVANVDRGVPLMDESVDLVTSIAARRNPPEFARVLRQGGRVLITVPGPDDLLELRESIGTASEGGSREAAIAAEFGAGWRVVSSQTITHPASVDRQGIQDLLSASYRGQRRAAAARLEQLDGITVTLTFEVIELELLERSVREAGAEER